MHRPPALRADPLRHARSGSGSIDLLALLPTYLAVFVPGLHALIDVRVLRLLRIFRVLKTGACVAEFAALGQALATSRRKIMVFMAFVMLVVLVMLVMLMGMLMYVVEGPANGCTRIAVGVYWAITTMTTVGFGDITPRTVLGRVIASVMMLIGRGTLAVPSGIVSAEFSAGRVRHEPTTRTCHDGPSEGHLPSARFCRDGGAVLPAWQSDAGQSGHAEGRRGVVQRGCPERGARIAAVRGAAQPRFTVSLSPPRLGMYDRTVSANEATSNGLAM